jgi:3-oxoadipate enol-lactonase
MEKMSKQDYLEGLFYEVMGEGEVIILLLGIGGSSNMFKPQVKKLSKYYKTVTVDLKGNGKSNSVKTKKYLDVHIKSILMLMKHLGIDKAIFAGLSYGGIITQCFAIKHPKKVSKIILIDTYAQTFPKNPDEIMLTLLGACVLLASWVPKKLLKKSLTYISPYKEWDLAHKELLSITDTCRAKDVTAQLLEVFNINLLHELNQLDIPALIIVGDRLKSVVSKSKEIAENLKNGEMYVVKNSVDPTNLCQPNLVNDVILNFINGNTYGAVKEKLLFLNQKGEQVNE